MFFKEDSDTRNTGGERANKMFAFGDFTSTLGHDVRVTVRNLTRAYCD